MIQRALDVASISGAFTPAAAGDQPGCQGRVANGDPGAELAFIQPLLNGLPDRRQPSIELLQAADFGHQAIRRYRHNVGCVSVQPTGLLFKNPGFLLMVCPFDLQVRA